MCDIFVFCVFSVSVLVVLFSFCMLCRLFCGFICCRWWWVFWNRVCFGVLGCDMLCMVVCWVGVLILFCFSCVIILGVSFCCYVLNCCWWVLMLFRLLLIVCVVLCMFLCVVFGICVCYCYMVMWFVCLGCVVSFG